CSPRDLRQVRHAVPAARRALRLHHPPERRPPGGEGGHRRGARSPRPLIGARRPARRRPPPSMQSRPRSSVPSRWAPWGADLAVGLVAVMLVAAGVPGYGVRPVAGAVPSLEEAVRAIEATYQKVADLRAPFRQSSFNRTMNQTVEATGTL